MASKPKEKAKAESTNPKGKSAEKKNLPETTLTGVNAQNTTSVLVSAVLEVNGQVRFGDGTDVGLTVTETDMVLRPSDSQQLQKFIFAGSKRRGVDRRTIHELRDAHWNGEKCYIPDLCCECPVCWLYGFTGTTQDKSINAKSRVLYASSVSVEGVQIGLNTHSRNQVDEKSQTTAGSAGIHEEQVIVAGVHFPVYTALVHVLDWEIGVFAHALLENVNSNRYTAASRSQGGIRFAECDKVENHSEQEGVEQKANDDTQTLLVIVDESERGIFPLAAPKIPGWENDWHEARKVFQDAMGKDALKAALEAQGFTVRENETSNQSGGPDKELVLDKNGGIITVKHNGDVLMKRYTGVKALGYLRQKQLIARQKLMSLTAGCFHEDIKPYMDAINPKAKDKGDGATGGGDGNDSGNE